MAFAFGLGPDAAIVIELLAFADAPFASNRARRRAPERRVEYWLAGVWTGAAGQVAAREIETPATPPFEQTMKGELERAKRLRLNGGVLVASVPGGWRESRTRTCSPS